MEGDEDPGVTGRLRLIDTFIEQILLTLAGCSQPSSDPDVRGKLGDKFPAIKAPLRGALEAFPFIKELGLII